VLVTARVQRQVAGLFVAEERGSHEFKGVPEPVTLYRIVRASGGGRRAGQRHLTPLVGREEELGILMRRWERARQGDGQLVLIVGEPGLGKSRLIEEFHARLRDVPHTWAEWSCSQLLQNTPLHPVTEWGRQRFGGADVPAEQRVADLENTLTLIKLDPAENVPLLAPLLDIPLPKDRVLTLPPEELRGRQFGALIGWTIASARVQPLVLAFEDLHWADPTTLDVLRGLAERGALAPLFIVATARPEFRPPWSMRSHHGTISLAPLDRSQVRDMVAELFARHALPRDVMEEVAARTGGVPLFVEEVTRLLLERGGEQGGMHTIPPTLQQSLTARLDRLGSAREVAQVGAVIGRGFSYKLLREITGIGDAPLQAALERLADADIFLVQGLPPASEYRFKHALIQDAAYENLLKSRRQALHRRTGEVLRNQFADTAEPALLAHHFTQAGLTEETIEWWGKAGQRSLESSALVEAVEQLTRALDQISTLPATPALRREQIKLQVALITPLIHVKGYAAPETMAATEQAHLLIEKAEALGEALEDPLSKFSVLYSFCIANLVAFDGDSLRRLAADFLASAQKQGSTVPIMMGHRLMGASLLCTGEMREGRTHLNRALALYDPVVHRPLAMRFGQDIRIASLSYRSMGLWMLGYPEQALADASEALRDAREIGHAASLMYALLHSTMFVHIPCGNYPVAKRQLDELVELAGEKSASIWRAGGTFAQGWLFALTGKPEEAIQFINSGLSMWQSTGATAWYPLLMSYLAIAFAQVGRFEDAWRCISEATTVTTTKKETWYEAEIYRVAGEIALKSPEQDATKVETYFARALEVARQQQTKSWELRDAMSMARDQGKRDEARELLTPVYGWFTEGFDTRDLKDAKVLLDELAS
jgi:predicted ATPase